mmetsp:Transcript_9104/g.32756  ORF Transcript_9104/g.32756 Transcript_9104/m.32756 type:complete len:217 (+) Transcript_9104:932-1582(+)
MRRRTRNDVNYGDTLLEKAPPFSPSTPPAEELQCPPPEPKLEGGRDKSEEEEALGAVGEVLVGEGGPEHLSDRPRPAAIAATAVSHNGEAPGQAKSQHDPLLELGVGDVVRDGVPVGQREQGAAGDAGAQGQNVEVGGEEERQAEEAAGGRPRDSALEGLGPLRVLLEHRPELALLLAYAVEIALGALHVLQPSLQLLQGLGLHPVDPLAFGLRLG